MTSILLLCLLLLDLGLGLGHRNHTGIRRLVKKKKFLQDPFTYLPDSADGSKTEQKGKKIESAPKTKSAPEKKRPKIYVNLESDTSVEHKNLQAIMEVEEPLSPSKNTLSRKKKT